MTQRTSAKSFEQAALNALPLSMRRSAAAAIAELSPFADPTVFGPSRELRVFGGDVFVPDRIRFRGVQDLTLADTVSTAAACLLTRSTDGFLRQQALRRIVSIQQAWVLPFVAMLMGDYVNEIGEDILLAVPNFDRSLYAEFIRQNRPLFKLLMAKATSYWAAYYRVDFPNRWSYPALAALREVQSWAS